MTLVVAKLVHRSGNEPSDLSLPLSGHPAIERHIGGQRCDFDQVVGRAFDGMTNWGAGAGGGQGEWDGCAM